ncbi:MAG: hypothetical protein AAGF15_00225 [Pseudomonadota bacterium]
MADAKLSPSADPSDGEPHQPQTGSGLDATPEHDDFGASHDQSEDEPGFDEAIGDREDEDVPAQGETARVETENADFKKPRDVHQRRRRRSDSPERAIRSNVPALIKDRQRKALMGWVIVASVVLLVSVNFLVLNKQIARALPAAKPIYAAIGLAPEARAVDPSQALRIVLPRLPRSEERDGRVVQPVTGVIENIAQQEVIVPPLRGVLSDANGEEVFSWEFRAPFSRLAPGKSGAFHTEVDNLPPTSRNIELFFVSNAGS